MTAQIKSMLVEEKKLVMLPGGLVRQYNGLESRGNQGLFLEIHRGWITMDNKLYLWDYEHNEFEKVLEMEHVITSVALVDAPKQVFVEEVKYLLVVSTISTTSLECVKVALVPNSTYIKVTVIDPEISVPVDGASITSIVGVDGRILMGGQDGHIHELSYQHRNLFNQRKIHRLNHTKSLLQMFAPSFILSICSLVRNLEDPIRQMVAADHKVYCLHESSTIKQLNVSTSLSVNETYQNTEYGKISSICVDKRVIAVTDKCITLIFLNLTLEKIIYPPERDIPQIFIVPSNIRAFGKRYQSPVLQRFAADCYYGYCGQDVLFAANSKDQLLISADNNHQLVNMNGKTYEIRQLDSQSLSVPERNDQPRFFLLFSAEGIRVFFVKRHIDELNEALKMDPRSVDKFVDIFGESKTMLMLLLIGCNDMGQVHPWLGILNAQTEVAKQCFCKFKSKETVVQTYLEKLAIKSKVLETKERDLIQVHQKLVNLSSIFENQMIKTWIQVCLFVLQIQKMQIDHFKSKLNVSVDFLLTPEGKKLCGVISCAFADFFDFSTFDCLLDFEDVVYSRITRAKNAFEIAKTNITLFSKDKFQKILQMFQQPQKIELCLCRREYNLCFELLHSKQDYILGLENMDREWHFFVYEKLLHNPVLLDLNPRYLDEFLSSTQTREHLEIHVKLLVQLQKYEMAASKMFLLSQVPDLDLNQRLEFLSSALQLAKCCGSNLEQQIQDVLIVCDLQLKIKHALLAKNIEFQTLSISNLQELFLVCKQYHLPHLMLKIIDVADCYVEDQVSLNLWKQVFLDLGPQATRQELIFALQQLLPTKLNSKIYLEALNEVQNTLFHKRTDVLNWWTDVIK